VFLDADGDPAAAEDLRGEDPAPGQGDRARLGDGAVDLDRGDVGFGGWERGRAGGAAARCGEGGELVGAVGRADGLDPGPAGGEVDDVGVGPEGDDQPCPQRAEPELFAQDGRSGLATPSFMWSTRFVPAPRNTAPGRPATVATALRASPARS
jgi:hypothetical protein